MEVFTPIGNVSINRVGIWFIRLSKRKDIFVPDLFFVEKPMRLATSLSLVHNRRLSHIQRTPVLAITLLDFKLF